MGENDGNTYKPPPRWLRGWRLLVTMAVTGLLLVVLALLAAVALSGNLKPVIERAKQDGLPTTWAELGLAVNPQHVALVAQMEALLAGHKSYGSTYVSSRSGSVSYTVGDPGMPLPEGYCAHVKGHSEKSRQQLREWMATLRQPIRAVSNPDVFTWHKYSVVLSRVHQMAVEEFLASDHPTAESAQDLTNFCRCIPSDSLVQLAMQLRCINSSARAIRFHLDALRSDPGHLPALLRQTAADVESMLKPAVQRNFAFMVLTVQTDPWLYLKNTGIALPSGIYNSMGLSIAYRLGRAEILEAERDWSLAVLTSADPCNSVSFRQFTVSQIRAKLIAEMYSIFSSRYFSYNNIPKTRLRLLATAAALDDAPWPVDPWSPSGAVLRELRQADGKVLVVYGVGTNGRDDGGKVDDVIIELRTTKDEAIKAAAATPLSP